MRLLLRAALLLLGAAGVAVAQNPCRVETIIIDGRVLVCQVCHIPPDLPIVRCS